MSGWKTFTSESSDEGIEDKNRVSWVKASVAAELELSSKKISGEYAGSKRAKKAKKIVIMIMIMIMMEKSALDV